MIGEIKDYRQPVVTSVGILLGFILNFLAGWAKGGEGGVADVTDAIILVSVGFAVVLMVIALFRILSATERADPGTFYRRTLQIYLVAVTSAFAGLWLAVLL